MLPLNAMFVRPAGLCPAPGQLSVNRACPALFALLWAAGAAAPPQRAQQQKSCFYKCALTETPEGSEICLRAPGDTKDWKKTNIYTLLWQQASFLCLGMAAQTQGCHILSPLPISSLLLAAFNAQSLSINYNPEMKGFVLPAED